jgi:hypothetical protein
MRFQRVFRAIARPPRCERRASSGAATPVPDLFWSEGSATDDVRLFGKAGSSYHLRVAVYLGDFTQQLDSWHSCIL